MTLNEFWKENPKAAIAFSGGVDSSYLLYTAVRAGAKVTAYYADSAFQPTFEGEDALRLAKDVGAELKILPLSVLEVPKVAENPENRCYYCKRAIFSALIAAAAADGYDLILDGTNASDQVSDRPGMEALRELSVRSPLRECGLTKSEIRELSRQAGLFTWDKPAYACLATRVPAGETITAEKLEKTEKAEDFLRSLGLRDFRVRLLKGCARIQVPEGQLELVLKNRKTILEKLRQWYAGVVLDLEVRL